MKQKTQRVWIVCDNNVDLGIILFSSLKAAQKYKSKYCGIRAEDCWIFNKRGTKIRS